MTVATESSEIDYVGDGVATAFVIPFPYLALDHIIASLTPDGETVATTLVLGVDYTLTKVGDSGTLTMLVAPAVDDALHIERTLPITQPTAYRTQGNFSPRTHENSFDRLTEICQQLSRRVAAVEAIGSLVPSTDYSAVLKELQFTTADPVEDTFPLSLALGTINPTGAKVVRARNLTDGDDYEFTEAVDLSFKVGANLLAIPPTYSLTINFVTGLEAAKEYLLVVEVLTEAVTP